PSFMCPRCSFTALHISPLSLHDALPISDQNEFWHTASANTDWGDTQEIGYRSWIHHTMLGLTNFTMIEDAMGLRPRSDAMIELRSEEHTSELQSRFDLVCRLLLEKKNMK